MIRMKLKYLCALCILLSTFASLTAQTGGINIANKNPEIVAISASAKAKLVNHPFLLTIETVASSPIVDVKIGFDLQIGSMTPYKSINAEVFNESDDEILVLMRLHDDKWLEGGEIIAPRSKAILQTNILRDIFPDGMDTILVGMDGFPGGLLKLGGKFNPDSLNSIHFVFPLSKKGQKISITRIWADSKVDFSSAKAQKPDFFPFIDRFGQYKHENFPGKISSEIELKDAEKDEIKDFSEHPGPENRDEFGGWANGPVLNSTGHFRTEKYQGKWWLITPNGHLFWSHGINCVRLNSSTPISNREHYFEYLPQRDSISNPFYYKGTVPKRGPYKSVPFEQFDFYGFNLYRKYGENFMDEFAGNAHKRLNSWGMNTVGNWSSKEVILKRKTPYTCTIITVIESVPISGLSEPKRKFPDPFHPLFRQNLVKSMKLEVADKTVDDPMCIGYFVDNELNWGCDMSLAETMLKTDKLQPAKQHWIQFLKGKYQTVNALNLKWGSKHQNWAKVMEVKSETEKMEEDLTAFNKQIAEKYFSEIRSVLAEYAPNKLYLGCRMDFHFYPTEELCGAWVVELAARYCDVVSFNRYRFTPEDLVYHDQKIDKPMIIGEMHFGALDRGMFHTGLRGAKDQDHRRRLYEYYYKGALGNPFIVGVHWFQYADQATTGRPDGENYQIGFVNIIDSPNYEIINASRYIGQNMYQFRNSGKN